METNILLLSNSSFFSVFTQRFLSSNYTCSLLNLRYPNENMSREEHLITQIQELYNEHYRKQGLSDTTRHSFTFNEQLLHRLDVVFKTTQPKLVFMEMKTFDESEWNLLKYISEEFHVPIAAFVETHLNSNKMMLRLAKNGVREVITKIDETVFNNIAKRNLNH